MHFLYVNCYAQACLISNQIFLLTKENHTCWHHSKYDLPRTVKCIYYKVDAEGYVYSVCEVAVQEGVSTGRWQYMKLAVHEGGST